MAELNEGKKAPNFTAIDDQGEKISLTDFAGKKVVLYFYPKDMTPGCTIQACDFRDSMAALKRKKVAVIGVSRDSQARHEKFKEKHDLNFPLIVDEDGELCEKYGVWQEKQLYGKKFMGIVRTTFVVDSKGKVAKIYPNVKVKGHVDQVIADLTDVQ